MNNTYKKLLAGVATLAVLLLGLAASAAAQQVTTGGIEGQVLDPQKAAVVGATVTARNVDTGLTRTAQTDGEGKYSISQLPPGNYEVRVAGANFKTAVAKSVGVSVGQNAPFDVSLEIGGASEEVTVVGSGEAQIERVDNTVSGVVGTIQIQNLPLNGRNFLDLAQLQPGVEKVEGGSFDPTKANYTGVSIGGQAGRSAQISVDGGSVVDNVVGTTVQNFSQEIVQEFQLGISNVDVSTGASGTGSVNIISRSGTNTYHGNGYLYWRDDKFAAFPAWAASTPPTASRPARAPTASPSTASSSAAPSAAPSSATSSSSSSTSSATTRTAPRCTTRRRHRPSRASPPTPSASRSSRARWTGSRAPARTSAAATRSTTTSSRFRSRPAPASRPARRPPASSSRTIRS